MGKKSPQREEEPPSMHLYTERVYSVQVHACAALVGADERHGEQTILFPGILLRRTARVEQTVDFQRRR